MNTGPDAHGAVIEAAAAALGLEPAVADGLCDVLAERIAARLGTVPGAPAPRTLSANEAAARIGLSPRWVREHHAELGGRRIGDGPKGRYVFPVAGVDRWLSTRPAAATSERPTVRHRAPRRGQSAGRSGAPLIPFRPGA